ncbi:MAG TPA: SH3 domain-containing protein, partial [Aggregatilineales bacterium]|nr:SH3 domain-containing protein [Aggregatilineales bacterium]
PNVPLPPTRIDGSSLNVTESTTPAPVATGVTAVTLDDLRLRAEPSLGSKVLTVIPFGTVVPVYGRTAGRSFLKVTFNGQTGWIASGFARLKGSTLAALPVVS